MSRQRKRGAEPGVAAAMLLALGAVATLIGWAALASHATPLPAGGEPRGHALSSVPLTAPEMDAIPEIVTVDTTLPVRRRWRMDTVTRASSR